MRFCYLILLTCLSAPLSSAADNLVLILDASGSMWGKVGSETKVEAARKVVRDIVGKLPAGSKLGLVAYGHRQKGDCNDIETLVPAGSTDLSAVPDRVDKLNSLGMTPITKAFEQGAVAAKAGGGPGTIVLVTDGLETCGGDPCAAVRAAKSAGQDFVLHIIGFDVAKENVSSLECAAQGGDGLYIAAEDAAALSAALQQTMTAESPAGDAKLSVQVIADGKLEDAVVTVAQVGKTVAGGRSYDSAGSNPRIFPLQAGTYDVTVQPVRIQGAPPLRFDGVVVESGKTVERVANFSTGEVSVKVTRNGALNDATVAVVPVGGAQSIGGGRTYTAPTSNPKVVRAPPGRYNVKVEVLGVGGRITKDFENVEIQPGERTDLEFAIETGTLQIGATQGGALIDAVVAVSDSAGKAVAGGRTYTAATSNPRSYELAPGKYTVKVSPVRPPGLAPKIFTMDVKAGATEARTVDF